MLQLSVVELEQRPGVMAGQAEAEELIGAGAFPLAFEETPTVPEQPLQVEQPLRQTAVPALVHADHAVDALHRAAGSQHAREHTADLSVWLLPVAAQLRLHHLL